MERVMKIRMYRTFMYISAYIRILIHIGSSYHTYNHSTHLYIARRVKIMQLIQIVASASKELRNELVKSWMLQRKHQNPIEIARELQTHGAFNIHDPHANQMLTCVGISLD